MKPNQQHSLHHTGKFGLHQAGFSLIEILVGLAIGLLATLVITQVFSVFEGQKRTTTGSADAQTNGSIALYSIGHELRMAGYGLLPTIDATPLDCSILSFGATGITDISPVTITDGGGAAGASDTITVRYGDTTSGGVPSQITGVGVPGANDVTIDNNLACNVGDVAMIVNGTTCNFTNVTPTATPDLVTVTLQNTAGAVVGANLACIGNWNTTVFQVNPAYDPTNPANSQAYLERNGNPSVSDIVNIQAQYGVSINGASNQVTQWVDASGGTWAAPTTADRNRIKALHIAVVARNGLYEKGVVTNTCTTAKGTANNGPCAWDDTAVDAAPAIDLSNDPNWQHYRYRVFETIIPLRNMIWASGTL
jgi:type IV pilus assembly protein PilW